jgi:hypothetical protein
MLPFARTVAVAVAIAGSPALGCPALELTASPYLGELIFSFHNGLTLASVTGRAGGMYNLRDCGLEGDGLTGYRGDGLVRVHPSLVVHWHGEATQLVFGAEFADPALLLVHDPEGRWLFDDGIGHNPTVIADNPVTGDYVVFIGSHGTTTLSRPGTLIISETSP